MGPEIPLASIVKESIKFTVLYVGTLRTVLNEGAAPTPVSPERSLP